MEPVTHQDLLRVEGLTVDFDAGKPAAHRALEGVAITIGDGEILGLVGESGSGKTVLSHSILGLLPPNGRITSGRIVWRGREIQNLPERQLRCIRGKEISMIFQDPQASLNPVYQVGHQVEWVLKLHLQMSGAVAKAEVVRLFEAVHLRDPERCYQSYPHQLSGGMCQRVMIAMALAGRPRLLIADEPTSALDVSVAAEMIALLSGIRDSHQLSILIITHDLGVATCLSNRIAVLHRSNLVEQLAAESFVGKAEHPASTSLIRASQFLASSLRQTSGQVTDLSDRTATAVQC